MHSAIAGASCAASGSDAGGTDASSDFRNGFRLGNLKKKKQRQKNQKINGKEPFFHFNLNISRFAKLHHNLELRSGNRLNREAHPFLQHQHLL